MEIKDFVLLKDEIFTMLTPREQKILEMRYQEGKTYSDIGMELSITGARVRQIEQGIGMKLLEEFAETLKIKREPCTLCGV